MPSRRFDRRQFLGQAGQCLVMVGGGLLLPRRAPGATPEALLPGKKELLRRSYRPPNYETPISYFEQPFTPNDVFFVRYHLAYIPEVSEKDYTLSVGGDGAEHAFRLSLDELKTGFPQVELAALCQCAGNRRSLFLPRVPGVQWGHGAMGNARWKGVRLRDILHKAGVKKHAVEVSFNGADKPIVQKTPDFIKSLPAWKALDENTLVAWEMNGRPLPPGNGFPARLVVPGWAATYWMKHLTHVSVLSRPLTDFWMKSAYRIPKGKFPVADEFPSQAAAGTTPITEMVVNSLIVNLRDGQGVPAGRPVALKGVAWDGGAGIRKVEVSTDGGQRWAEAKLGADNGNFSWRGFSYAFTPPHGGPAGPRAMTVAARATSRSGATQPTDVVWNPAGYHHNAVQRITLNLT